MLTADNYTTRPGIAERCRDVRADLEDGVPMTLGEIADRLGLSFEVFMDHVAGEMFRQDRTIGGVLVCEVQEEKLQ